MSRSATMTRRRAASLARSASAPRAAGAPRDLAAVPPTLLQTVAVTSRRSFLRVLSGTAAGAVLLSRRAPALLTAEAARPAVAQGDRGTRGLRGQEGGGAAGGIRRAHGCTPRTGHS